MSARGSFVWFELGTTHIEGAQSFYKAVMGWDVRKGDGPRPYWMWTLREHSVAGLMDLDAHLQHAGVPPHWLGYVAVDDVDATCEAARKLGGEVRLPGTDIPGVGRFAVLADPQGAVLAVFRGHGAMPSPDSDREGTFGWAELNTTDYESAWKFYSELLGWVYTSDMDMGPEAGKYWMFRAPSGTEGLGGMSNAALQLKTPPHWLYYVTVRDIDRAVELVRTNGGQVLNGPMDIPEGHGRIAQCVDPQGAVFAFHSRG